MTDLKVGCWFLVGLVRYTVVSFCSTRRGNVALLVRENGSCPYVTATDLACRKDGKFEWAWGHYFMGLESAVRDYVERRALIEG